VEWNRERGVLRGDEGERVKERVLLTVERERRKRERDLNMGRERMRRRRAIEKLERKGLGRETLPIASNVSFGAGPGRRIKIFGEIVNQAVRKEGRRKE